MVKAKILKIDPTKRRIGLGLKQKYIENGTDLMVKKEMSPEEKEIVKLMGKIKAEETGEVEKESDSENEEDAMDVEDNEENEEDDENEENGENDEESEDEESDQEEDAESDAEAEQDEEEEVESEESESEEEPAASAPPSKKSKSNSGKSISEANAAKASLFSSLLQDVPELELLEESSAPVETEDAATSSFVKKQSKQKKIEQEMEIRRVCLFNILGFMLARSFAG